MGSLECNVINATRFVVKKASTFASMQVEYGNAIAKELLEPAFTVSTKRLIHVVVVVVVTMA